MHELSEYFGLTVCGPFTVAMYPCFSELGPSLGQRIQHRMAERSSIEHPLLALSKAREAPGEVGERGRENRLHNWASPGPEAQSQNDSHGRSNQGTVAK